MPLDKLIEQGENLEASAVPGAYGIGKILSGIEFETWAAKVIIYLEKNNAGSSLTQKAINANTNLNRNSYGNYEYLLGLLKAVKEME